MDKERYVLFAINIIPFVLLKTSSISLIIFLSVTCKFLFIGVKHCQLAVTPFIPKKTRLSFHFFQLLLHYFRSKTPFFFTYKKRIAPPLQMYPFCNSIPDYDFHISIMFVNINGLGTEMTTQRAAAIFLGVCL